MTQTHSTVRPGNPTETAALDWQALLAEHDRWLRTVVYARVGEPQAVEEVMQEVALAAARHTESDCAFAVDLIRFDIALQFYIALRFHVKLGV